MYSNQSVLHFHSLQFCMWIRFLFVAVQLVVLDTSVSTDQGLSCEVNVLLHPPGLTFLQGLWKKKKSDLAICRENEVDVKCFCSRGLFFRLCCGPVGDDLHSLSSGTSIIRMPPQKKITFTPRWLEVWCLLLLCSVPLYNTRYWNWTGNHSWMIVTY